MKRTIFSNDFAPYYPIGLQPCPMYVNVANRIHELLVKEMELKSPDTDKLKKEIENFKFFVQYGNFKNLKDYKDGEIS